MRPNTLDDAVRAIAGRQQRNVTYAQLRALGLTQSAITHRLRKRFLHPEYPGVYSVGTPAATQLERASAAVLACGDGAALSHGSALTLWELQKRWDEPLHVTSPTDRRPRKLVVHQSRTLTRADIRIHHRIRVTSPARTLLDCAPDLPNRRLKRAVNDGLRSLFMTQAELTDVCARNRSHPGIRLLRPFVETPTGPTRSDFEDLFVPFCKRHDLPFPLINTMVCGYEVDAYFPAERVVVELDSWTFHRDREAFENDRNRDADLVAAGFVVVRITWERLTTRPTEEAARLHRILANRASELAGRSARRT